MKNKLNKILVLFFVVIVTGFSQDSYSLSFDGQDDYVEAGSNVNLSSTPFSIEVWYKSQPITTAAATNIIDNYGSGQSSANSWNLHIAGAGEGVNAGKAKFWTNFGGNLISDFRIDDGDWHHIAIERYDDGTIKMFIDGNDNNTGTLDLGEQIFSGYNILIGSKHYNRFHSCTISEVIISGQNTYFGPFSPPQSFTTTGNTLLHLQMNEGSGFTLNDISGNGNSGSIYGATWIDDVPILPTPPVIGGNNSLSFDGQNDYASILGISSEVDNSSLTLMGWFKATSNGEPNLYYEGIMGFRNYPSSDGNFFANVSWTGWDTPTLEIYGGGSANIVLTPDDQTWYHLAYSYDGTNIYSYLDGILINDNVANNDPIVPSIDLLFGNNIENGDHFFHGNLDEVSLWEESLSQNQIQNYMNTSLSGDEQNLVGYWNFDDGQGSTLTDLSNNGNNGTINGATWSGDGAPIEAPVFGCTDTYADNFNFEATSDDGSCSGYPDNGEYALSFDGDGDYVSVQSEELDNLFSATNPFTVSLWIYGNSGGNNNTYGELFDKGNTPNNVGQNPKSVMLLKQSDGAVTLLLYSGNTDFIYAHASNDILDSQSWNHITAVYDGGTEPNSLNLYKNGILFENVTHSGNGTFTGIRNSENQPFHFGSRVMDNGNTHISFSGKMDESTIWDRALSEQEVLSNMYVDTTGYQSGLVSHFKFDANSGSTLFDHSGNSNHGVISGATWDDETFSLGCTDVYADNFNPSSNVDDGSCSGYPDNGEYSLSFDNDNVSIGEIGDYSSKVTIMAWVKKDGTSGYSNIVSGGCGNLLFTENDNKLLFGSQCSNPIAHDTYGSTDIADNIWHHVAATYDADAGQNNLKVYVDGVLDGQSTKTGSFNVNSFRIGSNNNGNGEQYNGNIDMLRIWNTALTQEQIQENMNSSVASVETDLLADWKFNSGDGDVLYDHSGNQNHGTINGAAWSDDVYVPPVPPVPGENNSLTFDGVDDYVNFGEINNREINDASFGFWVKASLGSEGGTQLLNQDCDGCEYSTGDWGFAIGNAENRKISFWTVNPSGSNNLYTQIINDEEWYYIVGTRNAQNGVMRLYVNGILVDEGNGPTGLIYNDRDIVLGKYASVDRSYFEGKIHSVRMWDVELDPNDIQSNSDSLIMGQELVGHWNFNEGEGGTLTDLSGNGNNGNIYGATWSGDAPDPLVFGCMDTYAQNYNPVANVDNGNCWGYPNNGEYSLSFNGSDGSVTTEVSVSEQEDFSLTAWVKINDLAVGNILISQENDWAWYVRNFDGIQLSLWSSINADGIESYDEFQEDQWYHLAMTYQNNMVTHFVNGTQLGQPQTVTIPVATNNIEFGKWTTDNEVIDANISSVTLWSRAIDEWEIQNVMRNEINYYNNPDLVGYWMMNSGQGEIAFDHSGNANHGLISGPTWSDSVPYNGPFYVSTEGSDENQGSEGSPFATIQKAINSSVQNGNEIFVYPGVYQEKLLLENKDLTIRSTDSLEYDYDSSGVVNANVVIEGSYDGTIITINGGNYHFEDLLIRYGRSDVGGGIKLENAELMLHNCMVESNQTAGQGSKGAGIYSYNSRLFIERSTIHYNNADDLPGIGGGVYFENDGGESEFNFYNSVMINNNANGGSGGGLHMNNQGYYTQSQIENSIFDNNTTAVHGGGIYSDGQVQLNIYNSEIINNSAAGEGGGVNASDADLHMEETSVFWNSAGDTGGGLRFFNGNQNLVNTVIANNAASVEGGGIKFTGSSPSIDFCTIANNTSNVCAGGVVAVYNQVYIRNSIVYGNGAGSLCTIQGGSFDVSYSNIEGGYDGEENINADPLFCDADGDNFTLAQNSSSLNASEDGQNIGAEGVGCQAAYVNNALSFDGNGEYIQVSNFQPGINSLSVGAWFKTNNTSSFTRLISRKSSENIFFIGISDQGILRFNVMDGECESQNSYNDNIWHYVVGVWDGQNVKLYVDGLLEGSGNANQTLDYSGLQNNYPFIGGADPNHENFIGNIDEVNVWDIALSIQEVQSNMESELLGYESGLVGYWNFNEVQNSTVRDITGNGYDGTVYGAELSGDAAPIDPPPAIYGCNDPYAENYDLYANNNDGTCEYSQEPVTFTKEDYADVSLEENQDRITASVWITRGDNQPLYNAAFESYSDNEVSPSGTIWASGQTALQTSINGYQSFREATGGNHNNLPGRIMSMYIIQENLFYDVEFHSWTSNNNGGGFSYTRTPAEINSFDYGPNAIYFEKQDYADWNNATNQDRITDSTWITRGNQQGIFNAFSEQNYEYNGGDEIYSAPSNTLWAHGSTDEASEQEYKPFKSAVRDSFGMQDLPGHTFSLFLVSDNLYFDVEFHSWTSNGNGGGFSYTRTDENGNRVTFTKEDYADHTLEENQDRISESVWITREDYHPLFNFAQEQNYYDSPSISLDAYGSPENTEWSFGRTEDLSVQNYQPWQAAIGGNNPRGAIGRFMSLHLIEEDIYFDVVFHSWTCCGEGGGFSYTRIPINNDDEQTLNGSISGIVSQASDSSVIEGAHVIAVAEDNSFSFDTYSDSSGYYNLELVGPLNYYISISYEGLITHNEYLFIGPFENTELNVSLGVMQSAIVEGTLTDWYTNAPLLEASALFAYTNDDGEMETIESVTDENGYFMVQVPGEQDYDLFLYADGYWVEHDAFFLGSGENQVLSIGIPPINSAARLYGTVKDIESGDLIPYAEVQLNCDQASDWDHTGDIGTYRVFNYYPGDCDNGVLVVSADGYETSIQSVGGIDFEIGSSSDLEVSLMQGDDPDPGMLSGTVYSNIDGNTISQAEIKAYNVSTTQLFSINTDDDGSYQLFLPEADYYLSVNAQYHAESFDTLSIVSGQSYTRDFNLDQVPEFRISGVVSDQSGSPLSGFETFVTNGNGYRTTFTNEDGEYEIYVPNGIYDVGSGSNDYSINFVYGIEVQDNDVVANIVLESIQEFDGGFAGIVHLNDGDSSTVTINVWDSDLTYNAYVSTDENGAFTLPLVNGTYTIYAWVPNSEYESIYIPNAFIVDNNIISYDLYFIAPDGPDAPTIVFLEDVPNDQGGQLELAWTPGEPREYEIFPQYSVWRMEDGWNLIATVPYHGYDLYNMIVPTQGDSTADGIFESTFMVTAHTLDQNTFFDSDPLTGYSVDNIFPGIPQQLVATFQGESVDLEWTISEAEDLSHYNVYRQNQSLEESALVFVSENNFYSDNVGTDGDFQYWVTAVDLSGNESDASEPAMVTLGIVEEVLPLEFALLQNYPNPFNPSTQIMYTLPKTSFVKIVIYDMLGSKVRTLLSGSQDAGYKNVLWNATNDQGDPVSAGMYIYTIEAESFFASKKMILLK